MSLLTATCSTQSLPAPYLKTFWRLRTATQFSYTDISAIRRELQQIHIADEHWTLAREGHAAAAISMMIAEWPTRHISGRVDAIMTAVIFAALTGSSAAALVAYHTIVQLAARRPRLRVIATSWSVVLEERERCRLSRPIAPCRHECPKSAPPHSTRPILTVVPVETSVAPQ